MRSTKRKPQRRVSAGDIGFTRFVNRRVKVEVLEDRGFIGIGARQLVRVRRLGPGEDPDHSYEIPAEELELVGKRNGS